MSEQTQQAPQKEQSVRRLPVLPLKSSVLYPNLMLPLSVGRPASVAAVEAALGTEEKEILIVAQRDPNVENPTLEDLYNVGVRAVVKKMARTGDGLMELLVLGVDRVRLVGTPVSDPYMIASFVLHELSPDAGPEVEALQRAILELAKKVLQMANTNAPRELTQFLVSTEDPVRLAYFIGSMLSIETEKEQRILEAENVGALLQTVHDFLSYEVQILDSYDNKTYFDGQCGSIYKQHPPLVNANRKPGEWQTYDIIFEAPQFEDGKVQRPAHVTLIHNGVLVQNHFALLGSTYYDRPPAYNAHADKLPLQLQFHGNPVRFRNIWIREL